MLYHKIESNIYSIIQIEIDNIVQKDKRIFIYFPSIIFSSTLIR